MSYNASHYDALKCQILENEIQTFWPNSHVIRQISQGASADVFEIRSYKFGVAFSSALKVIRYRDLERDPSTTAVIYGTNHSNLETISDSTKSTSRNLSNEDFRYNLLQGEDNDIQLPEIFQNEINILDQLRGFPNVVTMEDLYYRENEKEKVLYIKMELLTSLQELIANNNYFSIQEILSIGKDICSALICCEEKHIIHRDIKPANLFIDKYGICKVGDFGVSKTADTVHIAHTMTGVGTISYMAPEIYRGRTYNNTVDIYALGLVLYQLLNRGRMPFMPPYPEDYTTADVDESNYKRLHGSEIPSLLEVPENILKKSRIETLDIIVRKACAYNPNARYHTARELSEALEECSKSLSEQTNVEKTTHIMLSDSSIPITEDSPNKQTYSTATQFVFPDDFTEDSFEINIKDKIIVISEESIVNESAHRKHLGESIFSNNASEINNENSSSYTIFNTDNTGYLPLKYLLKPQSIIILCVLTGLYCYFLYKVPGIDFTIMGTDYHFNFGASFIAVSIEYLFGMMVGGALVIPSFVFGMPKIGLTSPFISTLTSLASGLLPGVIEGKILYRKKITIPRVFLLALARMGINILHMLIRSIYTIIFLSYDSIKYFGNDMLPVVILILFEIVLMLPNYLLLKIIEKYICPRFYRSIFSGNIKQNKRSR